MLESANFEKEDLINHYHGAWISKQKSIQLEVDSKSSFEACKLLPQAYLNMTTGPVILYNCFGFLIKDLS